MGKQFVFDTCAFIHLEPYIIRLVLLSGAASKGKSLREDSSFLVGRVQVYVYTCTGKKQQQQNKTTGTMNVQCTQT